MAGKAEVDALAMNFPNTSSSIFGEVGVEPLQDGVGGEAEERTEKSLSMSKVKEAARARGSARAQEPEGHTQVTEAEGSQGAIETKEPEGSSGDCPTSSRRGKGPSAGIGGEWVSDSCVQALALEEGLFWAQVMLGQGD